MHLCLSYVLPCNFSSPWHLSAPLWFLHQSLLDIWRRSVHWQHSSYTSCQLFPYVWLPFPVLLFFPSSQTWRVKVTTHTSSAWSSRPHLRQVQTRSPCHCSMNMLKSSGLKIPGRGAKHSSPVGRTSVGGTSSPVIPKDSELLPSPDPIPVVTSHHRMWVETFYLFL